MKKKLTIFTTILILVAGVSAGWYWYLKYSEPVFVCPGTQGEAYKTFNGGSSDRWKRLGASNGCNWELIPGNSVKVKVPSTYRLDFWTGKESGKLVGPATVQDVVQGTMWKIDTSRTQ